MRELKEEDFTKFTQSINNMLATSERSYDKYSTFRKGFSYKEYTKEQVLEIIAESDTDSLIEVSLNFLYNSGLYRRTLCHYATILKYAYVLIPKQKKIDVDFSEKKNQERYLKTQFFLEDLNLTSLGPHIAFRVLLKGAYYGLLRELDNGSFAVQDLPNAYCRSRFKTSNNVQIVEFNVQYFDSITDKTMREKCLKGFPSEVRRWYNSYKNRGGDQWAMINPGEGLYFSLLEEKPFFVDMIPAIIDFEEYREIEKKKDLQDLKKILIQKLPLDKENEMVFEPEEAEEIHRGTVEMMKNNTEIDVLTSYAAEVRVEDLQSSRSVVTNNLDKIEKTVYTEAGVSKSLFSAESGSALDTSVKNDAALMMLLANQIADWITYNIDSRFGNKDMGFLTKILPIDYYNSSTYYKEALQGAQYGYSFILPCAHWNLNQFDLVNLKKAEIELLSLADYMKPLKSSYTQNGTEEDNVPTKKDNDEVTDKTLQNREAAENNG